ncbi:MAG: HNH endonuclease [Prevotella sp.]|nr:HNH endonuclease [Prevotella sp.]MDY4038039.1 HNH endonuclease [Prevotella sp.]
MDKQGFIDFNTRLSPENSGKADSYARAIRILDEVLAHQDLIDLHGRSLYDVRDTETIEAVLRFVSQEVKKMKRNEPNIFDYGKPNQRSYPLKNFCSSALRSLKQYAQYEQEVVVADGIVAQERNPRTISTKLIAHFDITKEGEDKISLTKQRKGQDYFRRMILANYGGRCALTGIDIPQLLLASHIIPWADKSHKKDRLNPCNGICLSALYDKAFDQGLITISPDDYCVILSSALQENETKAYYDKHFGCIKGQKLTLPTEYLPSREFLAYHRDKVFVGV